MKSICLIGFIFLGMAATGAAEKTTELYIPVGQSPGLSDSLSLIGKIDAVDVENQTLTVTGAAGTFTVLTTEFTRIFLDRSRLHLPNQYGTFSDLKPSGVVEVRFEGDRKHRPADWIKLLINK